MSRKIKISLAMAATAAAALPLVASPAFADYAPGKGDIVGVGSDTVQYAGDFVADGDYLTDPGFNSSGPKNRVVNFDATPDANARLAYGVNGGSNETVCTPGTGPSVGTGNQTTTHPDVPCTLNPTIVLRAGTNPVQRINGSGAGGSAGQLDTGSPEQINYVRASSTQASTLSGGSPSVQWDDIEVGQDFLGLLAAKTTSAVPVSLAQLKSIYLCNTTNWSQVGGANTPITPIIPQVGSGTRSTFLKFLGSGTAITPGSCVVTGEENDPFAIQASGNALGAIEPQSSGRLNLFLGNNGVAGNPAGGTSNGSGGYFYDPSCPFGNTTSACSTPLAPSVGFVASTGTASDGGAVSDSLTRPLFIYFRDRDINSTTPMEPGSTLNFVRTLFYNPGGATPYYASTAGQTLIAAAGIDPTYVVDIPGK